MARAAKDRCFESSPVPHIVFEQGSGRIVGCNDAACSFYGYDRATLLGRSVFELWRADQVPLWRDRLVRGEGCTHEDRWVHRRADGGEVDVVVSCAPLEDGDGSSIVMAVVEISDLVQRETELRHIATTDGVTGLPNRAALERAISDRLGALRAGGPPFGVMFVDLDRYRMIVERLGHLGADRALAAIGRRMADAVGSRGLVARLGADEFVIVADVAGGTAVLERLTRDVLASLASPIGLDDREIVVSASIGVVIADEQVDSVDELLTRADVACREAKRRGRAQVVTYDADLAKRRAESTLAMVELHRALELGEFTLHYQPIVDIGRASVTECEALIRWQHPEYGLVAPARFIPAAEVSGLIEAIGEWVINEACRQLRVWQDAGLEETTVSVNVSARQIRAGTLVDALRSALAASGVRSDRLTVELTESAIMEDPDVARDVLKAISSLGVRLSIDDFGTGYSSLAYLKQFKVDVIKVDRSFVEDVDVDARAAALVAAVVGLAHNFGSVAVGEGVETFDQLQFLRALRCDRAQGYLIGRPMPADEFERALRRGGPWLPQ